MLCFYTVINKTTTNVHLQFSDRCTDVKCFTVFHILLVSRKFYASELFTSADF